MKINMDYIIIYTHFIFRDSSIEELTKLSSESGVVAIGECGLDYNRMFSTKEEQIKWYILYQNIIIFYYNVY